jgi:hypothetical protein
VKRKKSISGYSVCIHIHTYARYKYEVYSIRVYHWTKGPKQIIIVGGIIIIRTVTIIMGKNTKLLKTLTEIKGAMFNLGPL